MRKKDAATALIATMLAGQPVWANGDEIIVTVESALDVAAYFKKIGFHDIDNHPERLQAVPRTRIVRIPRTIKDAWREDVTLRKSVFFRLGLSGVLQVNEDILKQRSRLLKLSVNNLSDSDRSWVLTTMTRYGVGKSGIRISQENLAELINRVDALPPSLVMAQGAIESGWLQSRFARLGQAVFGQWTVGKNGMKALKSSARLAVFDNPRASLVAYMLNLNTHPAYGGLRKARAELRRRGAVVSGYFLAGFLNKYAETGGDYVKLIRRIISRDDLGRADTAKLSPGPRILFQRVDQK